MNPLIATVTVLAQMGETTNEWAYVFAGYGIVLAGIALYVVLVIRKGRQLARQLEREDRRWMQ